MRPVVLTSVDSLTVGSMSTSLIGGFGNVRQLDFLNSISVRVSMLMFELGSGS